MEALEFSIHFKYLLWNAIHPDDPIKGTVSQDFWHFFLLQKTLQYLGPKLYIYKQAKTVSRFFVFLKYLQISTKFNYALC